MPNLKEVRDRIASVKNTQQITSAMKMVAASKLRKAQNAIQKMRPYDAKLQEILKHVSGDIDPGDANVIFTQEREIKNVLLVVISSNRGLCGSFNSNVIKTAERKIQDEYSEQLKARNLHLYTIGKKVYKHFNEEKYNIAGYEEELIEKPDFDSVRKLAEKIMEQFADGTYDKIEIIYNRFKNAVTQIMTTEQFLPFSPEAEMEENQENGETEYIYEPDKETMLHELLPKTLKVQFYKAFLDSHAAEHGARMTAMYQATENARELLRDLQLAYNKARQASITNEILEITTGAESLKG